jgi:hypothetical protein
MGAQMSESALKKLYLFVIIICIGLVASILHVPQVQAASKLAKEMGRDQVEYCKKKPPSRRRSCCYNFNDTLNNGCEDPDFPGDSKDRTECRNNAADALAICLNGVEKLTTTTPTFQSPQKVAPLAPLSPKTPRQSAPQPGVLAPTPAQPLFNKPSKTAPQQKVVE